MLKRTFPIWVGVALITANLAAAPAVRAAGGSPERTGATGASPSSGQRVRPIIRRSLHNDLSRPLRDIKPLLPPRTARIRVLGRRPPAPSGGPSGRPARDGALQSRAAAAVMPAPITSFDGVGNVNAVLPSDSTGDVGPSHYVQWVNLSFAIYSKSGTKLYGPAAGNTLWAGFPGVCSTSNDGDPIVQYDQLAGRWMLSQFAVPGGPSGYHQCVAVSKTGDPTGAYYRYDFLLSMTEFPDYPKFGVWPDAYYLSINQFSAIGVGFLGVAAVAFDRARMLAGLPAQMVFLDQGASSGYFSMLPTDVDGTTAPPAGEPNFFMDFFDNGNTDVLEMFKFHVDWTTPANSTFTGPTNISVSPFDSAITCGTGGSSTLCGPQPGTTVKLDEISDRLMYRLAYRNFGDHESLVVNHTVDATGTNQAGIRWYELRSPNATPSVFQQGTYAPDAKHRWMGSIAMDHTGDIAVGYTVSDGASTFPSIAYAGRLAGDPPNQLSQGQATMTAGSGSQTDSSGRWGDYTTMSVDPTDDCTFWYTNQYLSGTSASSWKTRIGSFRFPGCSSGADLSVTVSDAPDPVGIGANLTYNLTASNSGPAAAADVTVADPLPAGATLVSAIPSVGSCTGSATLTCSLGTLASGAGATIAITIKAPTSAGSIADTATISSSTADPYGGNNTASASTVVGQPCVKPGLTILTDDTGDVATPGGVQQDLQSVSIAEPYLGAGLNKTAITMKVADLTGALPRNTIWRTYFTPSTGAIIYWVDMETDQTSAVTFRYGTRSGSLDSGVGTADATSSFSQANGTITVVISNSLVGNPAGGATLSGVFTNIFLLVGAAGSGSLQTLDVSGTGTYVLVGAPSCAADVSVSKTDSPDPVVKGSALTYTLAVANAGPHIASGVTVSDPLPAGVTLVSATPTQGTCAGAGTITCSVGAMAASSSASIAIVVTPTVLGTKSNSATVSAAEGDPTPANNTSTATTGVTPVADLAVTKSAPASAHDGETITSTIVATNTGPDGATGVVLTDTLPGGASFVSASSTQGACTASASVSCAIGAIPNGASVTVSVTTRATSAGPLSDTASVSTADQFDPNTGNNSAGADTAVDPTADIAVSKSASPDHPHTGEDITYTIGLTNNGPDDATGVTLTDTMPLKVALGSISASQGSCAGSATITCDLGAMANGASATVTIVAQIKKAGTLANTAIASADQFDGNPVNNQDTATTGQVDPAADLSVTTSAPASVNDGEDITYTIDVEENGPDDATGVSLTDDLPSTLSLVSASSTRGTCGGTATVTCDLGAMADGEAATVTIVATTSAAGSVSNTAAVTATEFDPKGGNNIDGAVTSVAPSADVKVTKTAPASANDGDDLIYTVTVRDRGPDSASGVTLQDSLPGEVSLVSASPSQGTCAGSASISCDLGPLSGGDVATVTIEVTTNTPGAVSNTASASANEFDPAIANNADTATTTVHASADLKVVKSSSAPAVNDGDPITYTIRVRNLGPDASTGVMLADPLAPGLSFVSASATQGGCGGGPTVSCTLGTILPGDTATTTVEVLSTSPGLVTNTATASAVQFDPAGGNNADSASVTVNPAVNLVVTKSGSPSTVNTGDQVTYTVHVANQGPDDGTEVTLTDPLPDGMSFVSSNPGSPTCEESSGTVSCHLGTLARNDEATVSIDVTAATAGTKTNTATAAAGEYERDAGNNSASATTEVTGHGVDLSISKIRPKGSTAAVGADIVFRFAVTNVGQTDATNVMLADSLPGGATVFERAKPSQGSCSLSEDTVACSLGPLPRGARAVVSVTVAATAPGGISDGAAVGAAETDTNPGNNSLSVPMTVKGSACTLVGTPTANTIHGTSANDVICGLSGNDTLVGGGGRDIVLGGSGVDHLNTKDGDTNDTANGGKGNDVCTVDAGDTVVSC